MIENKFRIKKLEEIKSWKIETYLDWLTFYKGLQWFLIVLFIVVMFLRIQWLIILSFLIVCFFYHKITSLIGNLKYHIIDYGENNPLRIFFVVKYIDKSRFVRFIELNNYVGIVFFDLETENDFIKELKLLNSQELRKLEQFIDLIKFWVKDDYDWGIATKVEDIFLELPQEIKKMIESNSKLFKKEFSE